MTEEKSLLKTFVVQLLPWRKNDEELIAAATGSPFSWEIREAMLPEGFKIPTIKEYEGKSDSQDHLDHFNDLMELYLVSKMAK